MDEELIRNLRRWRDADDAGQDEEADAACLSVFATGITERPVPLDFAARTLAALDAAQAQDRHRSRRTRRLVGTGSVMAAGAVAYFGSGWILTGAMNALIGMVNLFVGLVVGLAAGIQSGADVWSVVSGIGRALAAFIADPSVTIAMLVLQAVAVAALIALQRLLGTQSESYK